MPAKCDRVDAIKTVSLIVLTLYSNINTSGQCFGTNMMAAMETRWLQRSMHYPVIIKNDR